MATKLANKALAIAKLRMLGAAARKAAEAQLKANTEDLVDTQKRFAPVDEGDLKNSIREEDVSDSSRIARRVMAGGREAPHARWVEFGRKHEDPAKSAARPFFFPAYRMNKKKYRRRMNAAVKKALKEEYGR